MSVISVFYDWLWRSADTQPSSYLLIGNIKAISASAGARSD